MVQSCLYTCSLFTWKKYCEVKSDESIMSWSNFKNFYWRFSIEIDWNRVKTSRENFQHSVVQRKSKVEKTTMLSCDTLITTEHSLQQKHILFSMKYLRKNVIRLPFMSNFIHWIDWIDIFIILQWNDFVSSNIRRVFVSFLRIFSYIHWMLQ